MLGHTSASALTGVGSCPRPFPAFICKQLLCWFVVFWRSEASVWSWVFSLVVLLSSGDQGSLSKLEADLC